MKEHPERHTAVSNLYALSRLSKSIRRHSTSTATHHQPWSTAEEQPRLLPLDQATWPLPLADCHLEQKSISSFSGPRTPVVWSNPQSPIGSPGRSKSSGAEANACMQLEVPSPDEADQAPLEEGHQRRIIEWGEQTAASSQSNPWSPQPFDRLGSGLTEDQDSKSKSSSAASAFFRPIERPQPQHEDSKQASVWPEPPVAPAPIRACRITRPVVVAARQAPLKDLRRETILDNFFCQLHSNWVCNKPVTRSPNFGSQRYFEAYHAHAAAGGMFLPTLPQGNASM